VLGTKYVFQFPVPETRYVADFYVPGKRLIIEVDGKRWHDMRREYDAARDAKIEALGYKVVRLASSQVENFAFTGDEFP